MSGVNQDLRALARDGFFEVILKMVNGAVRVLYMSLLYASATPPHTHTHTLDGWMDVSPLSL